MFQCIVPSQYSMKATVLTPEGDVRPIDPNAGTWVTKQDPDTGEIVKRWEPVVDNVDTDIMETGEIDCIISPLTRVYGFERFDANGEYVARAYLKMKFPPNYVITLRDQVTNIRDAEGVVLYREAAFDNSPTIYGVVSVDHLTDPFGVRSESVAVLQRMDVQSG